MILLLQTLRTRAWCNPTPTLICNLSGCLPGGGLGLGLGQVQEGKSSGRDLCQQLSSGEEQKQVGQVQRETSKLLRFPHPRKVVSQSLSLSTFVSHFPSFGLSSTVASLLSIFIPRITLLFSSFSKREPYLAPNQERAQSISQDPCPFPSSHVTSDPPP